MKKLAEKAYQLCPKAFANKKAAIGWAKEVAENFPNTSMGEGFSFESFNPDDLEVEVENNTVTWYWNPAGYQREIDGWEINP